MANKTPVPLLGRLAIQLKLVTNEQLASALQNAAETGGKLGDVMIEMGLINRPQLQKLEQVQQDVIAKHRAKKAAAEGGGAAPAASPPAARPSPDPVHAAAQQATRAAAPMTGDEVLELAEPAPVAARAPQPAAQSETGLEFFDEEPGSGLELASDSTPSAPAAPAAAPQAAPAASMNPPQPSGPRLEIKGDPGLELSLPVPDDAHRRRLAEMLQAAVHAGASDVHIHANGKVLWRVNGELTSPDETPLPPATSEALVAAALCESDQQTVMRDGEIDYCLELPGIGRFRANSYRQQRGFDSVYRVVSAEPPTLESLGLPSDLRRFTTYHQGMVLITGPAGCGKSATMAALVNLINEEREEHILCIEDPIEILHPPKKCLVNQRHAGRHTQSFARALRGALREDPDVIVIGELRDLETISLAMTAAETGHFVLATLHTNNAVRTINRMIGAFPASEQGQIRTMLSESLRAVISQRLVPRADGQGRVPALELLVLNKAISNLVRDEKTVQIRSSIQTGKAHGMYLLEQSLNELVEQRVITRETALRFSEDEKLITAK
jgi:twitching motility protein PilT